MIQSYPPPLQGACDAGILIPHNEKRFPGYDAESKVSTFLCLFWAPFLWIQRFTLQNMDSETLGRYIFGGHVADYMRQLEEEDKDRYAKQFSRFVKAGVKADDLEEIYKKTHAAIRANPEAKLTEKKVGTLEKGQFVTICYLRVLFLFCLFIQKQYFTLQEYKKVQKKLRTTRVTRRARAQQIIQSALAKAAAEVGGIMYIVLVLFSDIISYTWGGGKCNTISYISYKLDAVCSLLTPPGVDPRPHCAVPPSRTAPGAPPWVVGSSQGQAYRGPLVFFCYYWSSGGLHPFFRSIDPGPAIAAGADRVREGMEGSGRAALSAF